MIHSISEKISCQAFDDVAIFLETLTQLGGMPDLYIIDYYLPGCHCPDLIRQILELRPDGRIMVVSSSINPEDRNQAINAGAEIFINKGAEPSELLETVTLLLAGETTASFEPASISPADKFNLTPRQLETLILISKGLSNKEVARILDVSPETVKSHLRDIFQRFGVANRMEAIDLARNNGLA